ncbi:MAG: LamG-like jellyroll fold domain-containing protein, partial [Nanoarchaeota archaeon]
IGSWTPHTYYSGFTDFDLYIDMADVNGDGREDIITSPSEGAGGIDNIYWFEALLNRSTAWTPHIIDSGVETVHHFVGTGDFDLDEDVDVASSEMQQGTNPDEVKIYLNDGAGNSWTKFLLSSLGSHSNKVVDIDNDGDLDLFGANHDNPDQVKLWVNNVSTGTTPLSLDLWTYIQVDNNRVHDNPNYQKAFGLAMGDVNNDALGDIVSGKYIYTNLGGDMTSWAETTFPRTDFDALLIVDVDGDSNKDVVGMNTIGEVIWMENNGGTWSQLLVADIGISDHAISSQGYAAAELYSGGAEKKEIVLTNGGLRVLQIPSVPISSWTVNTLDASGVVEGIAVGNIDGDGLLDIVGDPNEADSSVSWWKNPGTSAGTWNENVIGNVPSTIADRFAVADLNNDGNNDVIVSVANDVTANHGVYWFKNPSWTRATIFSGTDSINSMDVADMDEDGDIDVIAGEHRPGLTGGLGLRVFIYENNNSAASWVQHLVSVGRESHLGARVADLDGDGDKDIASIAWMDSQFMHLWRNDANTGGTLPDTTSPQFLSASATLSTTVQVVFDENLNVSTAMNTGNYAINNSISVTGAVLQGDQRTIVLTTSAHTDGVNYLITVSNIRDVAGNTMTSTQRQYTYTTTPVGGSSSLVLWLKADDSIGVGDNAIDSSGNNNNGVCSGADCPVYVATGGHDGLGAYNFSAGDVEVLTVADANSLDTGNNFTLAFWMKPSKINQGDMAILNKGTAGTPWIPRAYGLHLNLDEFDFTVYNGGFRTFSSINANILANNWYHVAYTRDVANEKIYVNGNLVAQQTVAFSVIDDASSVYVGWLASTEEYDGLLDDIRIYNRSLTQPEIQQVVTPPVCGNNILEGTEVCECGVDLICGNADDNLNSQSCTTVGGFTGGILSCNVLCNGFDTSLCTTIPVSGSSSLVLWLKGDDDLLDGTAIDSSSYGNNAVCSGAICPTQDTINKQQGTGSYAFDGTNNYLESANSPTLDINRNQLTVAAWVNYPSSGASRIIIAKPFSATLHQAPYFAYSLHLMPTGGAPRFWITNAAGTSRNVVSATALSTGVWHHVAGTYDGTTMRLYVDGAEVINGVQTGNIISYPTPLRTGTNGALGEKFNGRLDDLQIYNRSLTAPEISQLYTGGGSITGSVIAPLTGSVTSEGGDATSQTTPNETVILNEEAIVINETIPSNESILSNESAGILSNISENASENPLITAIVIVMIITGIFGLIEILRIRLKTKRRSIKRL